MKSKLLLFCVLACFFASLVEGFGIKPMRKKIGIIAKQHIIAKRLLESAGALARPGEFPSVVGIAQFDGDVGRPKTCTGGIIHEKFVLTAAHCLTTLVKRYQNLTHTSEFDDSWVFVYANTTNLVDDIVGSWSGENRPNTLITRKAVKAYFVPNYFKNGVDDIAILELESPLNLKDGDNQKLKLPFDRENSLKGVRAVLARFEQGLTSATKNNVTLRKSHFKVVPYSKCQFPGAKFYQNNSMCLMSVDKANEDPDYLPEVCGRNLGGPLILGNTVIGIMSGASPLTCTNKEPQVSVNVRNYKDFIDNVINNQSLGNNESITELKFKA